MLWLLVVRLRVLSVLVWLDVLCDLRVDLLLGVVCGGWLVWCIWGVWCVGVCVVGLRFVVGIGGWLCL